MRHILAIAIMGFVPVLALAQEQAKTKIVSVGVFKNGLALVRQEVQVPGPGVYQLDAVPEPVHGSFWIKSNCPVETALKLLEVDTPRPVGGLQEELAGKNVVIHLKDNKAKLVGTVAPAARNPAGFIVLKSAAGYHYINPGEIAYLEAKGGPADAKPAASKQARPTLVLTVAKTDAKPVIAVSYLTQGISWAPSYLVDIAGGQELAIEMAAAVRNELAPLVDTEIKLMTGYPAIQFAHVLSPLSSRQNIEKFLAGMRNDGGAAAESTDTQFTSIGPRTMKEGEALALTIGRAKVSFERLVEWNVASDDNGSITEEIWDVFHFKNPFAIPMATAPALVMEKEQFHSQRTCSHAAPGEGSSLRAARALEMRTRGQEAEDPPKKEGKEPKFEIVRVGTHEYRRATIHGEMTITNQRKKASKVIVRRSLKGKVLSTQGEPKIVPQDEGLRAVNPSLEVVWTVTLAAGEEKTVRYSYQALILESRPMWGAKF